MWRGNAFRLLSMHSSFTLLLIQTRQHVVRLPCLSHQINQTEEIDKTDHPHQSVTFQDFSLLRPSVRMRASWYVRHLPTPARDALLRRASGVSSRTVLPCAFPCCPTWHR